MRVDASAHRCRGALHRCDVTYSPAGPVADAVPPAPRRRRRPLRWASALLALALATAASAEPFAFAVTGDAPYSHDERIRFESMLGHLDAETLAFVVHVGDIKSGQSECTDAIYLDRKRLFDSSKHPLVLIPGDNDWTDCDRWLGGRYVPEERLGHLRSVFFATPESLGRSRLILERQAADATGCCPENSRWWRDEVLFLGLHVVGSADNRGGADQPKPEFVVRRAATLDWLAQGFAQARSRSARAAVVLIHADAGIEQPRPGGRAYADFFAALRRETEAFGRPVLLVHGDRHRFVLDRPWWNPETRTGVENLVRLETFGSPTVGWVRVEVDPQSQAVFTVREGGRY